MLHQLSHLLEQQHMSLEQYLMMTRKTREEYLKDLQPDAESRVKRELVLDEVANKESITVSPEELEIFFRAYAQAGQELERSETQIRALIVNLRREKAITRLIELTTDPDPDAEIVDADDVEDVSIANAEAAALAADTATAQAEDEGIETEKSVEQPVTGETIADPGVEAHREAVWETGNGTLPEGLTGEPAGLADQPGGLVMDVESGTLHPPAPVEADSQETKAE